MKKILLIAIVTLLCNCSNPKEIKVDSKEASENVELEMIDALDIAIVIKEYELDIALSDYVVTVNSGKYGDDSVTLRSKFPELKDYDDSVLGEYVATVNSNKYDSETLKTKFPEFYGKEEQIEDIKRLTHAEFAAKVKEKYPEYKDIKDSVLVEKVIAKYPVYKDRIVYKKQVETQKTGVSKGKQVFFTPILIVKLSVVLTILVLLFVIYKGRKAILKGVNKLIQPNKIINSGLTPYLLELVFPIVLTSLFYSLIDSKDISEKDSIFGLIGFLFFFVLVLEWFRRKKDRITKVVYFKYLYVVVMLFIFILGVWYINQFN
jgi:hypothetical protein